MDFTEQLRRLEAANGDPSRLALTVLDIMFDSQPPELRRAVEAAAIPHWFDADILAQLLDEDMRPDSRHWFEVLIALPCVEPFRARGGYNVHELTRLALRRRLFSEQPERCRALAARAAGVFTGPEAQQKIEQVYHSLLAEPDRGGLAVRLLNRQLQGHKDEAQALTLALEEYAEAEEWPALVRGWGCLLTACNRRAFRDNAQTAAAANRALAFFQAAGDDWAGSLAMRVLGETAQVQGALETAQTWFDKQFAIAERLANSDPGNTEWQRDLSISYNKLGDVAVAQGKLDAAAKAYRDDLAIAAKLAAGDPGNTQWQRDLSVSYNKLGDVAKAQGQLDAAAKAYRDGLAIAVKLAAGDPGNTEWQRDLFVSYTKLGDVAVAQGQLDAAAKAYGDGLAIRDKLAAGDPGNTQWQRDLATSFYKISTIQAQQKHWQEALANAEASLKIDERLSQLDSSNATWQADVKGSRAWLEQLRQNRR